MLPVSFKEAMASIPASFERYVDARGDRARRMLLSDPARERGGLGGGVLPMCERMFREFILWPTPWAAADESCGVLNWAIPVNGSRLAGAYVEVPRCMCWR